MGKISRFLRACRIVRFGIEGQTFDITMRFAGFISLRNCISCPFIVMAGFGHKRFKNFFVV